MWYLKCIKTGKVHYLMVGKKYAIGRNEAKQEEAKIVILNDSTVSRNHASVEVLESEVIADNLETYFEENIMLKDLGAKCGTYHYNKARNKRVGKNGALLKEGDTVTFGLGDSKFEVCRNPLIITTSCLSNAEKNLVKKTVLKLGGHFVSKWREDCTHLIMSQVKVTTKAVCSMVSLKPLVTPDFLTETLSSINSQNDIPSVDRFIPPNGEPSLDSENVYYGIVKERKELFKGKTFMFFSEEQYNKMHLLVTLSGGKAILNVDANEDLLYDNNTCAMLHPIKTENFTQPIVVKKTEALLKRKKKRMIPESEIGMAIVFCSTQKFCNPNISLATILFNNGNLVSQSLTQNDMYVPETQLSNISSKYGKTPRTKTEILESLEAKENQVLNRNSGHSASAFMSVANGSKETNNRKRKAEPDIQNPCEKFIKTERFTQNADEQSSLTSSQTRKKDVKNSYLSPKKEKISAVKLNVEDLTQYKESEIQEINEISSMFNSDEVCDLEIIKIDDDFCIPTEKNINKNEAINYRSPKKLKVTESFQISPASSGWFSRSKAKVQSSEIINEKNINKSEEINGRSPKKLKVTESFEIPASTSSGWFTACKAKVQSSEVINGHYKPNKENISRKGNAFNEENVTAGECCSYKENIFEDECDSNEECNLMKVEFASLVVNNTSITSSVCEKNSSSSQVNYKAFRKQELPVQIGVLPLIIGGNDLKVYHKESKPENSWEDDSAESQSEEEEKEVNPFIYETFGKLRKRN